MNNARIRSASTDFFIAAALLALFGAASMHNAGTHGGLQIVLALLMGGAGAFLRGGTDEARLVGLGAAGLTVAVGGYPLVVQNDYFVGTIVAVFASSGCGASARRWPKRSPRCHRACPWSRSTHPRHTGAVPSPVQPTAAPAQAPSYPPPAQAPYYSAPVRRPDDQA